MKKITSLILLMFCTLVGYSQIISTGFETGVPAGWIVTHNGVGINSPWNVNNTAILANSGNSCLMVAPETATAVSPIQDWVITSVANLGGILNPKLSFYGKASPAGPTRNSRLEVRISTTNTNLTSFNTIATFQDFNGAAPNPISPTGGTYGFQELSLLQYAGQNIYVAFVMINEGQGKTWSLDDILIFEDCPDATNLGVTALNDTGGTANWSNPGGALNFQTEVVLANATPTGVPTYTTSTTPTTQVMTNLLPNTVYDYYVRSTCINNVFGDWVGPFQFVTNPLPVPLPYSEGFEGLHGWRYSNSTQVNKWFVGTATHNGGANSLYISNDDGANNTYTITTASTTHAYRDVIIPAGTDELLFTFDFKGQGQTTVDYMKLWSVPSTFTPTAGTVINATNGIQIGGLMNQTPNYSTMTYVVNVTAYAGTTRRFAFEWINNNSTGTQPPASVDNINISVIRCTAPSLLVLNSVTTQTANISWTAPTTPPASYDYYVSQNPTPPTDTTVPSGNSPTNSATVSGLVAGTTNFIWVRSNCGTNGTSFWIGYVVAQTSQIPVALPYSENFEGIPAFQFSNVNQPNYWMIGNATHNGGTKSMYVTNNAQNNEYTITSTSSVAAFKDFIIPPGAAEINIQFDFKGMGQAATDRMKVWLVPTTFVPVSGTNITAGTSGGVQIGLTNYSEVSNWTTYNNVINATALAGSNRRLIFEWINNTTTGTQPPAAVDNININVITCVAPTNPVLNSVEQDEATLSWTAPTTTNIVTYDYYYSTVNSAPTATTVPSGTTTGTSVTIEGLNPATQYFFWVRSNCGAGDGNSFWVGPVVLNTKQIPAELNFFDGFEGQSSFTLSNDNKIGFPNQWIIGNAVAAAGTKSLYISNGNSAFEYTTTSSLTIIHAYRDIHIPAGTTTDIAFLYDWRSQGENNSDYLRVWIVPVAYQPVPGTAISVANSGGNQLGGNHQLRNTWQNELYIFPGATYAGQTVRLVFEWRNNTSGGAQSPAAVDNVEVKALTCPAPIDLAASTGINNTINLTWTPVGTETQWEVVIQPTGGGSPGATPVTSVIVNGNPIYNFTPVEGQLYEYYVRAICSESDNSLWTGPEQFSLFLPEACADLDISPLNLDVNANGDYIICDGETVDVTLNAAYDPSLFKATDVYTVEQIDYAPPFPFTGGIEMDVTIDDSWAPPFTLPFAFCFYGNEFTTVQVSSNGYIKMGGNEPYPGNASFSMSGISSFPAPTSNDDFKNVIMGVFQDIDPIPWKSPNGSINYQVLGTYPCRALVVNYSEIELFSCLDSNPAQNSQIVIYEISNIIEVYVGNRESCGASGFNGGKGVIGLTNLTGTQATIPPGRNVGTWETQNEAWRFKPNGETTPTFGWYQDGDLISTSPIVTVTLDESAYFEAVVSYPGCGGEDLVLRKGFEVKVTEEIILPQAEEVVICINDLDDPDRGRINDNDEVILSSIDNPLNFTMTYYHSEDDAETGTNPIADPENYVPTTFPEIIYVRVENEETGCFGITSFNVREGVVPELDLQDIVICTSFTLSPLPEKQKYLMYEVLDPINQTVVTDMVNDPPVNTILPVGFYKVYVEIESDDKCTEVFSYKVTVIPCSIPKGISPNGDGLNDYLDLSYYMATSVKIFNRHGAEVYSHGPGYTNQWMGQSNSGGMLPSGTYFYTIVTPYENFTGWIQVV
ncbi:choice-of-anchor J domain-containing protein, partial [Paenimyroides tangerinum]|uniref:choice-of-anchor J domain-containing protein n=1 Tax=Paenimyroides tangerinum TaxID=2488728 RepID=UPI001939BE71